MIGTSTGEQYDSEFDHIASSYHPATMPSTMPLGAPEKPTDALNSNLGTQVAGNDDSVSKVAKEHNLDPSAIHGLIGMESLGNPKARTGSYVGLTQIGPDTIHEMVQSGELPKNFRHDQISNMSADQQVDLYGKWLNHYKFQDKLQAAGVDLSKMSPPQQAAVLQGFQFAPNATRWLQALGKGQTDIPVTSTKQAHALGSTSIADMTSYYERALGKKQSPTIAPSSQHPGTALSYADAPKEQTDAFNNLHIDRTKDVPLAASALHRDGQMYGVAIDKDAPQTDLGIPGFDPSHGVYLHEQAELPHMNNLIDGGMSTQDAYHEAHDKVATPTETAFIRATAVKNGQDPDQFLDKYKQYWRDVASTSAAKENPDRHPDAHTTTHGLDESELGRSFKKEARKGSVTATSCSRTLADSRRYCSPWSGDAWHARKAFTRNSRLA